MWLLNRCLYTVYLRIDYARTPVRNRLSCSINIATDKLRIHTIALHTYVCMYMSICLCDLVDQLGSRAVSEPQFRFAFARTNLLVGWFFWFYFFFWNDTCTSRNRCRTFSVKKQKKKKLRRKRIEQNSVFTLETHNSKWFSPMALFV